MKPGISTMRTLVALFSLSLLAGCVSQTVIEGRAKIIDSEFNSSTGYAAPLIRYGSDAFSDYEGQLISWVNKSTGAVTHEFHSVFKHRGEQHWAVYDYVSFPNNARLSGVRLAVETVSRKSSHGARCPRDSICSYTEELSVTLPEALLTGIGATTGLRMHFNAQQGNKDVTLGISPEYVREHLQNIGRKQAASVTPDSQSGQKTKATAAVTDSAISSTDRRDFTAADLAKMEKGITRFEDVKEILGAPSLSTTMYGHIVRLWSFSKEGTKDARKMIILRFDSSSDIFLGILSVSGIDMPNDLRERLSIPY
ncbi:MAG: outer membrane protein assembly factor BamE [Zoogloeaceae bacterium]|jgi:hypothetical protein|nr:outer membrane protein assembly factor BamE [Zoogloeaceae bacterium]